MAEALQIWSIWEYPNDDNTLTGWNSLMIEDHKSVPESHEILMFVSKKEAKQCSDARKLNRA